MTFTKVLRQRGLTLIELMVSVAISLAVLSSLVYVYVGSRGAYRTNDALARVQETGRFALEFIARDLRQAGYMGCTSRDAEVTVYANPAPAWAASLRDNRGIRGFEKGAGFTYPATVERLAGDKDSDVLEVILLDPGRSAYIDSADFDKAQIKLVNNCPVFIKGEVLVAADCTRAALFAVTKVDPSPDPKKNPPCNDAPAVEHGSAANATLDGNGNPIADGHKINPALQKQAGAVVAGFVGKGAVTYFIGRPKGKTTAPPSLYRMGSGDTNPERVVENVEDFELLFGIDTTGDNTVDTYLRADQMAAAQWRSVLSVRVSLVAVSPEGVANSSSPQIYLRDSSGDNVPDAQATPGDRRLRQVFSTTVALRNRLR